MSSEIMPLIWEYRNTLTFWKLAREKEMNIQGFLNDPESMIITQNVKSAEMENTYLYKQTMNVHIIPILELIRKEVNERTTRYNRN